MFKFILIFFTIILYPLSLSAEEVSSLKGDFSLEKSERLSFCVNKSLGIQYFCSSDWKRRDIDDAVLLIISSDPAVTLTITKIESNIIFLEQLTKPLLEKKGLYADGFQTSQVKFGKKSAMQVKAYSKQYSGRRLLDYYFMHDSNLYAVLFSVHPKEKWDDYKFLIKKVRESFTFVGKPKKRASQYGKSIY